MTELGTRACYNTGCAHPECRAANATYHRARRGKPTTRPRRDTVDAQPITAHIASLPHSLARISRLSGVSYRTVRDIAHGRVSRVTDDVAQKIGAVYAEESE